MVDSPLKDAKRNSFRDLCVFDSWKNRDDENCGFVGIRMEKGFPKFHFPMGYGTLGNADDGELKRDFFRLMELVSDKALPCYLSNADGGKCHLDFPFFAFRGVLEYYLDFGYFVENEIVYAKGSSGKIVWSKTIKSFGPQLVKDNADRFRVAYLKQVTRKSRYREDSPITLVHKFCVFMAVKWIGPLFGVSEAEVDSPEIDFDCALFEEVLLEKLGETFNDRSLELFRNLLFVTKFLANGEIVGSEVSKDLFGVSSFAPVWEMLVDRVFGNFPPGIGREFFNPHCRWRLGHESDYENRNYPMRPDTIMWNAETESLFVLDAKYYKYGVSGSAYDLPTSNSICKQIAYAEYAERLLVSGTPKFEGSKIYNAFVMPYCADELPESLPADGDSSRRIFKMRFVGTSYGDWKKFDCSPADESYRPYHSIAGILLDVKTLIRNGENFSDARNALAFFISRKIF